jgi:hypothetical protein
MTHVVRLQHWVVFGAVAALAGYATYAALRRWVFRRRRPD